MENSFVKKFTIKEITEQLVREVLISKSFHAQRTEKVQINEDFWLEASIDTDYVFFSIRWKSAIEQ